MLMAYTEIGIGNATFINTEIEYSDGREVRQPGFVKFRKFKAVYVRAWLGKKVYALSTDGGFSTKQKNRKAFKALLGFSGSVTKSVINAKQAAS